jgi:lipopolysaccharide export LptBFGC system permease protein LptF
MYSKTFWHAMPLLKNKTKKNAVSNKKEKSCAFSFCSLWKIFFVSLLGIAVVVYFVFLPLLKEVNISKEYKNEEMIGGNEKEKKQPSGYREEDDKRQYLIANIIEERVLLSAERDGDMINFQWTKYQNNDFDSYTLLRSESYKGDEEIVFFTEGRENTSFSDRFPKDDGPYYYKVFIERGNEQREETNIIWL